MLDNQFETGNTSRMLAVKIDPAAETVTEQWEYSFAPYPYGYSECVASRDLPRPP